MIFSTLFQAWPKIWCPLSKLSQKGSQLPRNCFNLRKTFENGFKFSILIKRPFSRDENSKKYFRLRTIPNSRPQLANLTLIQTKTTRKSLPFRPPTPILLLCRRFVQSPFLIFMSFTRFRQSLCFSFFFTFVGSKVGVAVGALASHLCDPGSVPVVGTWVEFVVGSVLAPNFPPSTKTNTSKLQFNLDVKWLQMMCGPHTMTLNLNYLFFLLHMSHTYSWHSPFSNLHAICIVWPDSLFPFTWFLQDLGRQIYMLFTGYRTVPYFSFTCSLYVLFKKFTGYLQRRYCKFVPQNLHVIFMVL